MYHEFIVTYSRLASLLQKTGRHLTNGDGCKTSAHPAPACAIDKFSQTASLALKGLTKCFVYYAGNLVKRRASDNQEALLSHTWSSDCHIGDFPIDLGCL